MNPKSKGEFQIQFSFQGAVENIRFFSSLGKNVVRKFWPDDRDLQFEVELFLSEALGNAFIHAHNRNPQSRLGFLIERIGVKLCIRVFDNGPGFSLEQEMQRNYQDPLVHHGRGLRIIRELADHLYYKRGRKYNEMVFEKNVEIECVESVNE